MRFEDSEYDRYTIRKGDLVICEGGDIGRAAIWDKEEPIHYQNALHRVRFNEGIDARFVLYYLYFLKQTGILDGRYGKGVTIKHLVKSSLISIPVPVPTIDEQKRIVDELDLLSGIIDTKNAQLHDLDALAQSIFYEMFGDPERSPFPIETLRELSKTNLSYGSGASAIPYDGKLRYVRITDIDENGELNNDIVSPSAFDEKYLLHEGDLLFARSGATVGKTYLYHTADGDAIYAGYLIRVVPDTRYINPKYLFSFTKTDYYRRFIGLNAQAVAQPNINAKQYGSLKVIVPPLDLQHAFAAKIEALEQQKTLIKKSLQETETLLASRMDHYFGE